MQQCHFQDIDGLKALIGEDYSDWSEPLEVSQEKIDSFAALTGDSQWIHVDPERAKKESPFGTTIAHGFLTLSLMPSMNPLTQFSVTGYSSATNYGAKALKFIAPVLAGSTLHARSRLLEVEEHPKGTMLTYEVAVQAIDSKKPALLYQMQLLYRP